MKSMNNQGYKDGELLSVEAAVILRYHNGEETRAAAVEAAKKLGWPNLRQDDFIKAGLLR